MHSSFTGRTREEAKRCHSIRRRMIGRHRVQNLAWSVIQRLYHSLPAWIPDQQGAGRAFYPWTGHWVLVYNRN